MSHTPGPWTLEPKRAIGAKCFTGETKYVCDYVRGGSPEEAEANARLIAAAPELLEALRHVASTLSATGCQTSGAKEAYRLVRAAIAKATGGAQ